MDERRGAPIRVIRVIDRLNVGGPAKHVTWLSAGLDPGEFETRLLTGTVPRGEGDMSYFACAAGVEPVVIREMSRELSPRDVVVVWKLVREFLRFQPRIVHTHKAKAGAVGRVAARIYQWLTPSALLLRPRRCEVVHTYHGHVFHSYYGRAKTRLFIFIERVLARFCTDRIVTISPQQRDEIHGRFGIGRSEQFAVIPLGIDIGETGTSEPGRLRREMGLTRDEPLVGIVGRLCEVKNHALFIGAAAQLVDEGAEARFAIIGDGHPRAELERQASDLAVADRIVFTGFRDDVASLYPDLDIVALTSLNEGTPLTLIEAMSNGCAVVSTEVGGVVDLMGAKRDTVGDFSIWDHGITTPSRNLAAFTNALKYLIERPGLRREMGGRGREFIRSRYSKERLIADVERLYRELL
ncbi:MAG: glycosyltransferase [Gammaproteobacteria bacterium]